MGSGTVIAVSAIAKKKGYVAKLSKLDGVTYFGSVRGHCPQTVLSFMKSVIFYEVDHVLVRMCKFQRESSKRMRQLQNVSEALECMLFKAAVQ